MLGIEHNAGMGRMPSRLAKAMSAIPSTSEARMRELRFSDDDQACIRTLRYHHPDPRALKRLEILTLRIHDEKQERIATLAGCSRSTVGRVLATYAEQGLDATLRFHEVGPECELDKHRACLETDLTNQPPRTVAEAQDRIEKLTGIRRGSTQVRAFLRNTLGFRWRKARSISVPPKKSVAEQVAIQQDFVEQELNPRLDEARQGRRTVLFMDASHMVLGAFLSCLWSVMPLFIRSASGRQRYNVLGAINPLTLQFFRVCKTHYINSASVCELLRQIASAGISTPITLVLELPRLSATHR
jgi:transposase